MHRWLAAAAFVPVMVATAALADAAAFQGTARTVVRAHAPDLKLPPDGQYPSSIVLQNGMIAEEGLAPNALVGVGLPQMSGRKAQSLRINEGPVPTRNPGVSFVMKF